MNENGKVYSHLQRLKKTLLASFHVLQHLGLNESLVERSSAILTVESCPAVWIKSFIQPGIRRPLFTASL